MKLKLALGLGLACAACCAFPAILGAGALGAAGVLSGNGIAMLLGGGLLVATGVVYVVQRRRRAAASAVCDIVGSCGCKPQGVS